MRIAKTILIIMEKIAHPGHVSDLKGKTQIFTIQYEVVYEFVVNHLAVNYLEDGFFYTYLIF